MFGQRRRTAPLEGPATVTAIQRWLVEQLAARVGVAPGEIRMDKSFEAYGLDSRAAVQMSGDLEKAIGRRLSPGLLYEHPTIAVLSDYLAAELGAADPS